MIAPELLDYVRSEIKNGISNYDIRHEAELAGWSREDAELAIRKAHENILSKIAVVTGKIIIVLFAVTGAGLIGAYTGVYMHLTDTKGIIDNQTAEFWNGANISNPALIISSQVGFFNKNNYCSLSLLKDSYYSEFQRILTLALQKQETLAQRILDSIIPKVKNSAWVTSDNNCLLVTTSPISREKFELLGGLIGGKSPFLWVDTEEWSFFKSAVLKDRTVIDKVANETGISSRLIVSELAAEQMRLFYSNRGWFKKAISPLKVLGSMTQFSWGVSGIKAETAIKIESNLKDSTSPFYLGSQFEHFLDFKTKDVGQERFTRITDDRNRYYAYLYLALYNKEIIQQWTKSGFSVTDRPEVLATLYNIGFNHSVPNANPQTGGSVLTIGGESISFGRFSYEFYYSNELLDDFPLSP